MAHAHGSSGDAQPEVGHVAPQPILIGVGVALMILTVITVAVTRVDFGASTNLVVAMTIAVIKGSLVVIYFMHLRWDRPFNAVVLLGALLFVGIFVGFALTDTIEYERQLIPDYAPKFEQLQ